MANASVVANVILALALGALLMSLSHQSPACVMTLKIVHQFEMTERAVLTEISSYAFDNNQDMYFETKERVFGKSRAFHVYFQSQTIYHCL